MEDCGQVSPLTVTLRGILRDYGGHQICQELLQNADDAGASKFIILLDKRTNVYNHDSLLSDSMKHFQGPALYQFDDVSFKREDFASIQRIGDGLKRGDPTKTGNNFQLIDYVYLLAILFAYHRTIWARF